jgi:hypothetical protein
MAPHFLLNPAFQIVAAYLIFIVGFALLFALALFCIALICLMYKGAIWLLPQWERQEWSPQSKQTMGLTPQAYHK